MTRSKPARYRATDEPEDVIPDFKLLGLCDEDGNDGQDFIREESTNDDDLLAMPNLPARGRYLTRLQFLGTLIEAGTVVELVDGDFLKIKYLFETFSAGPQFKGVLFRRARRVDDMLPKKSNELCMICKVGEGTNIDVDPDSFLVCRQLADVVAIRQLICTNCPFPTFSWRESPSDLYKRIEEIEETAILVCRWRYTTYHAGFAAGGKVAIMEESLERLREWECDRGYGISEALLRQSSRVDKRAKTEEVDLTEEYEETITTTVTQEYRRTSPKGIFTKRTRKDSVVSERYMPSIKQAFAVCKDKGIKVRSMRVKDYTSGDIGSGGCGMASGARQAGLHINFLLDHSETECDTARMNFAGTNVLHMSINDFCNARHEDFFKVDILHVSFPCQPHSAAHTVQGKNDEANIASGYSVKPLLMQCRPRVMTIEQTSGIITHNGGWHFRALIHQLTDAGYSTRWKIVNCADYGNVQPRKRLILLCAAPGESLPSFPAPTHGIGRTLKPYTTIRDILRCVPSHVEQIMQYSTEKYGTPYDSNIPLAQAITTSGGESNLHPNGRRSFTLQELALLQGFLPTHRFAGTKTAIKRQIGNAVPGCVAKAIFGAVIDSLRETDGSSYGIKTEVETEPFKMEAEIDHENELPGPSDLFSRRGSSMQTAISLDEEETNFAAPSNKEVCRSSRFRSGDPVMIGDNDGLEFLEELPMKTKTKKKRGGFGQGRSRLNEEDVIMLDD